MGDNNKHINYSKPRLLSEEETPQTLKHWQATVEVLYSRDTDFEAFFDEDVTWNPNDNVTWGFEEEQEGLKRTAAKKGKHMRQLLVMISSHIPWPHIQESILQETRNFKDVWEIIFRAYSALPTHDTFLDLMKLNKKPTESNLTFYERLVGHVRTHLAAENDLGSGKVRAPTRGDKISVTILDMVTAIWLDKIDKKLAGIVRTEFQVRLRSGTRISSLVEVIAPQADQLLARYDATSGESVRQLHDTSSDYTEDIESLVEGIVQRLSAPGNYGGSSFSPRGGPQRGRGGYRGSRGSSFRGGNSSRGGFSRSENSSRSQNCPFCQFLKQAFQLKIPTDHSPTTCSNRPNSVRLMSALGYESESQEDTLEDAVRAIQLYEQENNMEDNFQEDTGISLYDSFRNNENFLQSERGKSFLSELNQFYPSVNFRRRSAPEQSSSNCSKLQNKNSSSILLLNTREVERIKSNIKAALSKPRKAKSPALLGWLEDKSFCFLLDEGAEIAVIDSDLAKKLDLKVVPTQALVKGVSDLPVDVRGQTASDLVIKVYTDRGSVPLNLGRVPVISNLGCGLLIGEAAKADNKISTVPWRRTVKIYVGDNEEEHSVPYLDGSPVRRKDSSIFWIKEEDKPNSSNYFLFTAKKGFSIGPGGEFSLQLPPALDTTHGVIVVPRQPGSAWINPGYRKVSSEKILTFTNNTDRSIYIQKRSQIADLISCEEKLVSEIMKATDEIRKVTLPTPVMRPPDLAQFVSWKGAANENFRENIKNIQVDPDQILPTKTRQGFHHLHEEFQTLFTDRPGKFNGSTGYVDGRLNFSRLPSANDKISVPRVLLNPRGGLGAK